MFTDGLSSYPRAIKEELGAEVEHEVIPCLGNPIEQSHRGIKQHYYPTLGFGAFESNLPPLQTLGQTTSELVLSL